MTKVDSGDDDCESPVDDEDTITFLQKKVDDRSTFAKDFEDDSLWSLQDRMLAKMKTKNFTAEDFVKQAEDDLDNNIEVIEVLATGKETEEPEEDEVINFFG